MNLSKGLHTISKHLDIQKKQFEQFCDSVMKIEGVRYIAIIDHMGRPISEKVKKNFSYLIPEEKVRMAYMQLSLDLVMRKEFTKNLGMVERIISYRAKVNIVTLPMSEYFAMLSIERGRDVYGIIDRISALAKKSDMEI